MVCVGIINIRIFSSNDRFDMWHTDIFYRLFRIT